MAKYKCPYCGGEMKENGDFGELLECIECGTSIDAEDGGLSYDEINAKDALDEDEMPPYCKTCGGPYPSCKISCKLFDD